ncbi:MAG: hypothetical protein DRP83_01145 [Planctomycetota bacterium]|nr:MAG: hypothetical protein DRP83_01145 [Planctomycetota bacterium]
MVFFVVAPLPRRLTCPAVLCLLKCGGLTFFRGPPLFEPMAFFAGVFFAAVFFAADFFATRVDFFAAVAALAPLAGLAARLDLSFVLLAIMRPVVLSPARLPGWSLGFRLVSCKAW